jgi:hypothetical protein
MSDPLPIDLEGCERGDYHCHGRRRGPDRLTPEGNQRVCHVRAGRGTNHLGIGVCKNHGGATRFQQTRADRIKVAASLATYGGPVDIDPAQALLTEVRRTAGHVEWLGRVLAAMPAEALTWGRYEVVDKPAAVPAPDGSVAMVAEEIKSRAGANMVLQLYQQERKHLVLVAKAAIDAGASQRMVDMFTSVGAAYINMIERILDGLDLSEAQAARVPTLITGELEQITQGDI